MIRFVLLGLLAYLGYRLFRLMGASDLRPREREGAQHAAPGETELIQDPQCGTYFLKGRGIKTTIEGRTVHFCSKACRDAYRKAKQAR